MQSISTEYGESHGQLSQLCVLYLLQLGFLISLSQNSSLRVCWLYLAQATSMEVIYSPQSKLTFQQGWAWLKYEQLALSIVSTHLQTSACHSSPPLPPSLLSSPKNSVRHHASVVSKAWESDLKSYVCFLLVGRVWGVPGDSAESCQEEPLQVPEQWQGGHRWRGQDVSVARGSGSWGSGCGSHGRPHTQTRLLMTAGRSCYDVPEKRGARQCPHTS